MQPQFNPTRYLKEKLTLFPTGVLVKLTLFPMGVVVGKGPSKMNVFQGVLDDLVDLVIGTVWLVFFSFTIRLKQAS